MTPLPSLRYALAMTLRMTLIAAPALALTAAPALARKPLPPVARPCLAAQTPVNYGGLIRPAAAVRRDIQRYRGAWAAFCKTKRGSINRLMALAERVRHGVEAAIGDAHKAKRLFGKNADLAHTRLQKRWPGFVPAFMGSIIEFEFFRVQMRVVRRFAKWGDASDKAFFAVEKKIFGTDQKSSPWVMRTWDYGGCTEFDTYNWVGNVRKVAGMRKNFGGWYSMRLAEYEADLKRTIKSWAAGKVICTCGFSPGVSRALARLQSVLKRQPGYAAAAGNIGKALRGITSGRIKVDSDKKQQCKYG